MAGWGWIAIGYAAYVVALALAGRTRRRTVAAGAAGAFAAAAAGGAMVHSPVAQAILPGAVALAGYWLSGFFVGMPQDWLEQRLRASDRRLFDWLSIDRGLAAAPGWMLELLELSYATVYVVVMAGAVLMSARGRAAVQDYWATVLPAGFICYAALPFLRCRPPRSIETPGVIARRAPALRRVNERIVASGSIQANTIPSGHVATALAAGLAVAPGQPVSGAILIACAILIAIAATLGRYHYAVDCLSGAIVALLVWIVVAA